MRAPKVDYNGGVVSTIHDLARTVAGLAGPKRAHHSRTGSTDAKDTI